MKETLELQQKTYLERYGSDRTSMLKVSCRDLQALKLVWSAIEREAERYTEEALIRLSQLHEQRLAYLCRH